MNVEREGAPRSGRVVGFAGFRRSVTGLARALDFYCGALGFTCERAPRHGDCIAASPERDSASADSAFLMLGDETVELHAPPPDPSLQRHAGSGGAAVSSRAFQHLAIVTRDMAASIAQLAPYAPALISRGGAVTLPAAASGVTVFKFRDVDGHPLELISFPEGVGDPKWQRHSSGGPTLGIDHSAITVADTERSIAWYTASLGFDLVSRQTNRGPAQDRLDGVAPAVVDVVGLQPVGAITPHLELLGYLEPPLRPSKRRAVSGDVPADRMLWWVDDLQAIASRFGQTPRAAVGARRGAHRNGAGELMLRDPDGHLIVLRQSAAPAS
ncbi:MAG: VOC family protein [Pseudomonadota bacterium]|nr:VOC family protein [Pseudomonadota bacterium]